MFKILDKRNGEVTAEQQAVFNKISTNNADGYVDGFLNSLRIAKMSSNVISIDSGLLSIQGFRSVNDTLTTYTVSVTPSEPIPFQLVATYSHYISDENDTLEITTRPTQELRREPLFSGQNAVYEVELAEFNMTADGIADFAVTLEKIVYNEQDLSELLDKVTKAEQDSATALEKVNELETQVIEKQGTAVYVGDKAQSRVNFTSDPQTQISDIVSGAQTVGKAKQDANGNVIDKTYATKTDTAAISNISTAVGQIVTKGWHTIVELPQASISNGASGLVTVTKWFQSDQPFSIVFAYARTGYGKTVITLLNCQMHAAATGYKIGTDASSKKIQLYQPVTRESNEWSIAVFNSRSGGAIAVASDEVDTDTSTRDTEIELAADIGLATTGQIYQQGAPVFATDPSKLEPSTANGWTQTTATGSLPSAGVYMVAPNSSLGYGIGIMFYAENRTTSSAAIGVKGVALSLGYAPSGDPKWTLNDDNATEIPLIDVCYKRIA